MNGMVAETINGLQDAPVGAAEAGGAYGSG